MAEELNVTKPTAEDCATFLAQVREGVDPFVAARELGFTSSAFKRHGFHNKEFLAAYEEAKEIRKGLLTHRVDERADELVALDDVNATIFVAWAKRNSPEWQKALSGKLELTGTDGEPVTLALTKLVELARKPDETLELEAGEQHELEP